MAADASSVSRLESGQGALGAILVLIWGFVGVCTILLAGVVILFGALDLTVAAVALGVVTALSASLLLLLTTPLGLVGMLILLGSTRPGVGALQRFAEAEELECQLPTLRNPVRVPSVSLPDGVEVRVTGHDLGSQLVFSMPSPPSPRVALYPHRQRPVVPSMDAGGTVDLAGTALADGWWCASTNGQQARAFLSASGAEILEMLQASGEKAGQLVIGEGRVTVRLWFNRSMPSDCIAQTVERMRRIEARWATSRLDWTE